MPAATVEPVPNPNEPPSHEGGAEDVGAQRSAAVAGPSLQRGVDVYDGQGEIDWQEVFASGVTFALIKATESTGNVQDTFAGNRERAAAAGIGPLGLYHFARPENANPEAQADHYLDVIGALGADEFVALDVETGALSTWPDFILRFFARIEARLGPVPCCLYVSDSPAGGLPLAGSVQVNGEAQRSPLHGTRAQSLDEHRKLDAPLSLSGTSCGQFPLWDAGYGANTGSPPAWGTGYEAKYSGPFPHSWNVGPWDTWTIWQYSSVGRVPGIGGGQVNVDMNLAPSDLRARLGIAAAPAPPAPPAPPEETDMAKPHILITYGSGVVALLPNGNALTLATNKQVQDFLDAGSVVLDDLTKEQLDDALGQDFKPSVGIVTPLAHLLRSQTSD